MSKVLAKTVQLGVGIDALGSTLSLSSVRTGKTGKKSELEVTPLGVRAVSGSTGRVVLVPFANIRGIELMPVEGEVVVAPPVNQAPKSNASRVPGKK